MIKTLQNIMSQDKEKFVIPRSVQQVIPIQTIWNDGIFKIGKNKFSGWNTNFFGIRNSDLNHAQISFSSVIPL